MSTITPDRIAELWPVLSEDARRQIAEIVEAGLGKSIPLKLSDEDERALALARDDYKHGRALDAEDYHAAMSAFMQRLAAEATQ